MSSEAAIKNLIINAENAWVQHKLDQVLQLLKEEIHFKQQTISRQEEEISKLRTIIEQKNGLLAVSESRLAECHKQSEGNRQLVNKLLNDLRKVQNDVEWYKRTYEKRSLWGVLKQKFISKA